MFNAYLISTLKFQFEKNYKFNYITSAMFNAYKISTLKLEKIKYFDKLKNSEKIEKKSWKKVCHYQISETETTKKCKDLLLEKQLK